MCPSAAAASSVMNSRPDDGETDNNKVPSINLLECTASELASFLLEHRFQNDALQTASFFLEALSSLPNAEEISAQLLGGSEEQEATVVEEVQVQVEDVVVKEDGNNLGKKLTETTEVSLTTPRGKFQFTCQDHGLHFGNAKQQQLCVHSSKVEHVIIFPKPEECRRGKGKAGDMVLLCMKEEKGGVEFKGKNLYQLCLQLPSQTPVRTDGTSAASWMDILCESLSLTSRQVIWVQNPNASDKDLSRYMFKSHDEHGTSTTTGGMPCVQCYHGVQDGVVYPLQEGLLFFKPPFFLHRSRLESIACGRGAGGSRYVDMNVTYDENQGGDPKHVEFTNIHRDELNVLNDYIQSILIPAMKRDLASSTTTVDDVDADMKEEDSETSVEAEDSDNRGRRSKRKASQEATQMNRAQVNQHDSESEEEGDDDWGAAHEEVNSDSDVHDDDEEEDEHDEEEEEKEESDEENVDEEFFEEDPSEADDDDEMVDAQNVEEEFFEEPSGTESEGEDEPAPKRPRPSV